MIFLISIAIYGEMLPVAALIFYQKRREMEANMMAIVLYVLATTNWIC